MNSPRNTIPTTDELRKSYDDLPYTNRAKPFTHISRIGAIGKLRGLSPAAPPACSVLELGCADGENLFPMAIDFPKSKFMGIDLSPVQIETGIANAARLSISNVKLQTANILELTTNDLGKYDFIIAHGVFSWVPSNVQEKILTICRDHLTDNGLAYISYNTYPGWLAKQAHLEMFRYHTRQIDDPRGKAESVVDFLQVLPTLQDSPGDPPTILLQRLRHELENMEDPLTYLAHEYLVDADCPFYFTEFLDRAREFDLQYVDDAYPGSTSLGRLPFAAAKWVSQNISDFYEQQQYVDFMCNVSFRRSLLCRSDLSIQRGISFNALSSLFVNAICRRVETDGDEPKFKTDPGRIFSIENPDLRRLLECLVDARPASVSMSHLRQILGSDIEDDEVAAIFNSLLDNAVIEFISHPFSCIRAANERPRATRLVRQQVNQGIVTSAAHRPVQIADVFHQQLLPLLDGTKTASDLVSLIRKRLTPEEDISDGQWKELVVSHLENLAELGLIATPEKSQP